MKTLCRIIYHITFISFINTVEHEFQSHKDHSLLSITIVSSDELSTIGIKYF